MKVYTIPRPCKLPEWKEAFRINGEVVGYVEAWSLSETTLKVWVVR